MRLNSPFKNSKTILLLSIGILLIISLLIFLFIFDEKKIILLITDTFLNWYLSAAESVANVIIKIMTKGVSIENHEIIFTSYSQYFEKNRIILENWTEYLLYKKWSAFLLLSFWLVRSSVKKKIKFTFLLFFTHFLAVVSGLILVAGIGPLLINPESLSELRPNTIGTIAMVILFAVWVKASKTDIQATLKIIKINFKFSDVKINEILIVFFLYILLLNFFVPYINYYLYIEFLLQATKSMVTVLDYHAEINGPYLSGTNGGTLFMAKWCLGLITMFVFASMVYLTRRDNKTCGIFIFVGIIILHILNIVRLSLLFIFVQNHDDSELIMDHHDIYNIVVYLVIFALWIIWIEKFSSIKRKKKTTTTKMN